MNNLPTAGGDTPQGYRPVNRSTVFVLLLVVCYAVFLWRLDRSNGTFSKLTGIGHLLLVASIPVFASYLFRYIRWHWLLLQRGSRVPFWRGFSGYLAGFALTATPGKAGELLRIRYFTRLGVPAQRTAAVFVFERVSDLLVILLLSLTAAGVFPTIGTLTCIVLGFVLLLFLVACSSTALTWVERLFDSLPFQWMRRFGIFVVHATHELPSFLRWRASFVSLLSGLVAWGLTSAVFVGLCHALGIDVQPSVAFGIYPLAMLIGALSFIPGGVGTTELAIVLMLGRLGIPTSEALAVAVGTRLVTLWFAIGVGGLAVAIQERLPPLVQTEMKNKPGV